MESLFAHTLFTLHLVSCICQSYPYFYHDTFQEISDWQKPDNVFTVSSPNCPSFAASVISTHSSSTLIKENKICISNSYKELFDGQYLFESYNYDLNASIYLHKGSNRYFSAQITSNNYEYNIHSFAYDNITKARCIISKSIVSDTFNADDLRMCIRRWKLYDADLDEWNSDTNMISVPCQHRCITGNDKDFINDGVFEYHSFNVTRGTPIYYCSECHTAGAYLSGWIYSSGRYVYRVSKDPNLELSWSYCYIGSGLSDDYIFSLDDCTDYRRTWNSAKWIDDDWIPLLCDHDARGDWKRKVCINGAESSDINGEYFWLYYDAVLRGSWYLNANDERIAPSIDMHGDYYWIIGDNYMRCNISDAVQEHIFDVNDCVNEWEINTNGVWIKDSNVFMTECTDICVTGNDKYFIPDGAIFSYVYFNVTRQTNIYFCEECMNLYLFGATFSGDPYWYIGDDPNILGSWSYCFAGNDIHSNYVFNIEDCLSGGISSPFWLTWDHEDDKYNDDDDMIISKCYAASDTVCMLLGNNVTKEYVGIGNHTGFALGFDVNTINMASGDSFIVEYSCAENNVFDELMIFTEAADASITDIIYQLPTNACNYQNSIAVRFKAEEKVYLDNVYLYYNITNILFTDEMTTHTNWEISSMKHVTNVIRSDYCPSDGSCLRLGVNNSRIASMMTTIHLIHKYKDLNLKWYAITTGLREGSYFVVEYQCDNNYFYTDELCHLQQYDNETDCTESSCAAQSYNLPSECDFTSEIVIKFTLQNKGSAESVYIDYVTLSHSDALGTTEPGCIDIIAPPTIYTTVLPTIYTTISEIYTSPSHNGRDNVLFITIFGVIAVLLIVVIYISVKKCLDLNQQKSKTVTYVPVTTTEPQLELQENGNLEAELYTQNACASGHSSNKQIKLVDNPLIMFFGIACYEPEHLPDLDDIDEDETFFRNTFEKHFHYKFVSNGDFNRKWSKKDALHWILSTRDDILIKNQAIQHNGLVFCGASHGSTHGIICSDGEPLLIQDIRSLFSWSVNIQFKNIPKLFVFNSCRTEYEMPRNIQSSNSTEYLLSITGKEGNPVFGSKLSRYVATAFAACYERNKQAKVYDVLREATNISKQDPQGIGVRIQEHDLDIDDVIFIKHGGTRGAPGARKGRDTRQISPDKTYQP